MVEEYETDVREQKAWRRVVAASRKLAKQDGHNELGEEVANASHQDPSTRSMRRMEALASLLEALVDDDKPEPKKVHPAPKPAPQSTPPTPRMSGTEGQ